MFTSKSFTISALLFSLFVAGCATSPDDDDQGLRSGSLDVSVQLKQATGGEEDGTILWEILDVEVNPSETVWEVREYEPGTHPVDGGEEDGTILWEIVLAEVVSTAGTYTIWEINDPTGSPKCVINHFGELRNATGTLLLEESGGSVYAAGGNTLLYTFDRFGINDATGRVLGTNPAQNSASAGRKLTIGALLEGYCR
jgi:hypothetical protein